jgi:broad specificity phosphatase PhoE
VRGGLADLTPRGFIQAEKVAERVSHLPVEVIVASTMVRAQQTAGVIAKRLGMPFESSDLFTERREPSSLIGLAWGAPETQRQFKEWSETFTAGGKVGDGENYAEINERAKQALKFLEGRREEHILVVTHAYFMRHLFGRLLFGDKCTPELLESLEHGLRTANTGLTIFHHGEPDAKVPWRMTTWNDHAHLG